MAYINPKLIAAAADVLSDYKKKNPASEMPMAEVCANIPENDRARYVRAARRLGWNVTKTLGRVYENGRLAW